METMKSIHAALSSAFPQTPLLFLLGNHDFPGAPVGAVAAEWYPQVASLWAKWMDSTATAEFSKLGYYSMPMPTHSQTPAAVRLIALNTEHFNHGNAHVLAGETVELAFAQLNWLNATLTSSKARGEKAWLFWHVPPGMETGYLNDHSSAEAAGQGDVRPNWMPIFLKRYTDIVDEHADTAVFQAFGHEHVDTFRLSGTKSVLFSVPSLSTAYPRTNPPVRLWHSQPAQGFVLDWTQYHMDLIASNKRHEPL